MTPNNTQDIPSTCKTSEETLRAIYNAQWQDLHHSRNQDWRLCNLILVGLIGVGGLKVLGQFPELQRITAMIFSMISLLAIGITERHRSLFSEKMDAIRKLEKYLNAPEDLFFPRKGLKKHFKVQYLLSVIYFVFSLFFLYVTFFEGARTFE